MTLPLLISVPHAGLIVPPKLKDNCILTPEQIIKDGDEEAAGIYDIADRVAFFVSTKIARAILDMNRAKNDRRKDGIVKTHTCWDERVYKTPLLESQIQYLIKTYHCPYHKALSDHARNDVILGIDCHTMASYGPPVGPDSGCTRPMICLSSRNTTCPDDAINLMAECFRKIVPGSVKINDPFMGGYIIEKHQRELPWIQLEVIRGGIPIKEKKQMVLQVFEMFVKYMT